MSGSLGSSTRLRSSILDVFLLSVCEVSLVEETLGLVDPGGVVLHLVGLLERPQ